MRVRALLLLLVPALLWAEDSPTEVAWDVLNRTLAEKDPVKRSKGVTALGTIGNTPKVVERLQKILTTDMEAMVRQTAVAALGEMRATEALPYLRNSLNDPAPEVSFLAAKWLWTMGDHSGLPVVWEVLGGERRDNEGLIAGAMRDAKLKLHNPRALAMMGAREGLGALFGPAAMGLMVAQEVTKDTGAVGRVTAAQLLAEDTDPRTIQILEYALQDKNHVVRAAAARALGQRLSRSSIPKLEDLFLDDHELPKAMAAAAVIRIEAAKPVEAN
jgi:HEAT repeat protein